MVKKETIIIKGMHCKNCTESVKRKLMRLKGVKNAKVNLANESAIVEFDPKKMTMDELLEEVSSLGYDVEAGDISKSGKSKNIKSGASLKQGIIYGLLPHTGCIAFIVATVLGVTVATELFKPLLMNPYFFYILIAISFIFATISVFFYLKNQGFIGIKLTDGKMEFDFASNILQRKWKYLSTMYGTTIGINLLLFFFIFPYLANFDTNPPITGAYVAGDFDVVTMSVKIPCPGHAPLISGELKKVSGVLGVKFRMPNLFDVTYDSSITTDDILSPDVFNTYKPTLLDESVIQEAENNDEFVGGCGAECGGSCGGEAVCGCGG